MISTSCQRFCSTELSVSPFSCSAVGRVPHAGAASAEQVSSREGRVGLGGARAAEDRHRPVRHRRGGRRAARRRRQRAHLSAHIGAEHRAGADRLQRAAQRTLGGQRARPGAREVLRAGRAEHRAPRQSTGCVHATFSHLTF